MVARQAVADSPSHIAPVIAYYYVGETFRGYRVLSEVKTVDPHYDLWIDAVLFDLEESARRREYLIEYTIRELQSAQTPPQSLLRLGVALAPTTEAIVGTESVADPFSGSGVSDQTRPVIDKNILLQGLLEEKRRNFGGIPNSAS